MWRLEAHAGDTPRWQLLLALAVPTSTFTAVSTLGASSWGSSASNLWSKPTQAKPLGGNYFPSHLLFPAVAGGCGRRAYMAGGEGLHAPLEQHGNVQPRQGGQLKSAQSSKHQQNAARQYAYMRAPCTHSNAFSTTALRAGHAVQSKQSRGHKPIYPC